MKYFTLLSTVFILAGCATYKTSDDLMNSPKTIKKTFVAPMNYQKAYRILAEMTRKCLQASMLGNKYRTEENLDNTHQFGEIRFINHNLFWGDDYFGYYLVKPTGDNQTELTTYHQQGAMVSADNSKTLQSWLKGNESCSQ